MLIYHAEVQGINFRFERDFCTEEKAKEFIENEIKKSNEFCKGRYEYICKTRVK